MRNFSICLVFIALLVYFSGSESTGLFACTGLMLKAKDNTVVHGRTLEFAIKVDTSVAVIPRDYSFKGTSPLGQGLSYQSKYSAVGVFAFNNPALLDGMNEKGLSVGTFYFPGFAGYSKASTENQNKSLSPADFPNWILTQFATIDELKAALNSVVIVPTVLQGWGNETPPFHYIVYDKYGKSLVIEPVDGKLLYYDNPLGVLTNSPNFEWHLTNLRNFVNLTTLNAKPVTINGLTIDSFGQGSGMVGLPGDFTPPSRFVRATIFSVTATTPETNEAAVAQIFHILNQFDIPVGVIKEEANGVTYTDFTLMTAVRDPSRLKYYFKTYENPTVKVVDLNTFDLNAKTIKTGSMSGKATAIDISSELK